MGHTRSDIALLIMRLGAALLLFTGHGWPKIANFAQRSATFSDPLGVGSGLSLGLVVFAEVFCAIAVMLGLLTRLAVIPILVFFVVAYFHHADDPWSKREFVLVYALPFLTLLLTGPGRFSVDHALERARFRRAATPGR